MIYLISIGIFTGLILLLVIMLLFVESAVLQKGDRRIVINGDDENTLNVQMGTTLLSALVKNDIYLPSACGGSGSCGQCRCKVVEGGGDILPTELPHLSRSDKKKNIRLACQLKIREDLEIEIPPEIFAIQKYHGTVASNQNIGTFIKELVVQLNEDQAISFKAGQYMQIDIPPYQLSFADFDIPDKFREPWDEYGLWNLRAANSEAIYRAYSLANPPAQGDRLVFTVRIAAPPPSNPDAPPGVGSSYIFSLKPGDPVSLSGPFGDFQVKQTTREMCFIGGGAGMAPLRSQIIDQLQRLNTDRIMSFWYGARNRLEMLYDGEFRELDSKFDNFTYHVALSEPLPGDEWTGLTGFIHRCLHDEYLENHLDPSEIEYYLCGPPAMISACLEMLESLGVEPEMIAYDEFS